MGDFYVNKMNISKVILLQIKQPLQKFVKELYFRTKKPGLCAAAELKQSINIIMKMIMLSIACKKKLQLFKSKKLTKSIYDLHFSDTTSENSIFSNLSQMLSYSFFSDKSNGFSQPDILKEKPAVKIQNTTMLELLSAIHFIGNDQSKEIDYSNMPAEELGSVYESLLDLKTVVDKNKQSLRLTDDFSRMNYAIHYTDKQLTAQVVKHTLDPLFYDDFASDSSKKQPSFKSSERIMKIKVCDPAVGSGAFLIEICQYLSEKLVEAWKKERKYPNLKSWQLKLLARKKIAYKCIYAVDIDSCAVEVAMFSLLVFIKAENISKAKNLKLKVGDSLTGSFHKTDTDNYEQLEILKKLISTNLFDWRNEFPEVFKKGGFDAITGNPPFVGGHKLAQTYGKDYKKFLSCYYSPKSGLADLSAFFFLRAWELLAPKGCIGLIATNTISQGNTRRVALEKILKNNGIIYRADTTKKWRGKASLAVSIVYITSNKNFRAKPVLNGKLVVAISSSLNESISDNQNFKPHALESNKNICFTGPEISGSGFLVPYEQAELLLSKSPHYSIVLKPYITGTDIVSKPRIDNRRMVIDFDSMPLKKETVSEHTNKHNKTLTAEDFPELLKIVEQKVKPIREASSNKKLAKMWWQFSSKAVNLNKAIKRLDRIIVCSLTSKYFAFRVIKPSNYVFSILVKVFASDCWGVFAFLSSSIHDFWARLFCSTLEDRLRYTTTEIFETLPMPKSLSALKQLGESFHNNRQKSMISLNTGLTGFYNKFHDQKNWDTIIKNLRDEQVEIDNTVIASYNWNDIRLEHDFYETTYGKLFTISDKAKKELFLRLISLNHKQFINQKKSREK